MLILQAFWDLLSAAGGTVALSFIIALALGINALTILFLGSSVIVLEGFARAVRRARSVVIAGLCMVPLAGALAYQVLGGERFAADLSPLAKRESGRPQMVERFEGFMGGMEICNAFSELNDPDDQRQRFLEQAEAGKAGDTEAEPLDEDFLRALEHGMPPTGGMGMGIDRLLMAITGLGIRETILFPLVK